MQRNHTSGFTLVELAIVLVIIGLLIGGILVGQDMIKAAERRAIVKEKDSYTQAVATFRLKFNALPGDMINPQQFFPAQTWNAVPDGNGRIVWAKEGPDAWRQMELAGFISGGGMSGSEACGVSECQATLNQTIPASSAYSGAGWSIGVNNQTQKNMLMVGLPNGDLASGPIFTPLDAAGIDAKADDGLPQSGSMRARGSNCDTGANVYNSVETEPVCVVDFAIGL